MTPQTVPGRYSRNPQPFKRSCLSAKLFDSAQLLHFGTSANKYYRGIGVALGITAKMSIRTIPFVVGVVVMSTGAVSAQNRTPLAHHWTQNLYAKVGASYLFQQDTTLTETIVAVGSQSGTAAFNPGFRGDLTLGYNFNQHWAAEFDTGVLWSSIDKFNGISLDSLPYAARWSLDTYTVPFLANVIYKLPLKGPWSAYVEAGAGGAANILTYTANTYDPGDCKFGFAYQAEAGLQYALTKNFSIGINYKFLGTANPAWQFNVAVAGNPPAVYRFKENGFYTHSIGINLTWTF